VTVDHDGAFVPMDEHEHGLHESAARLRTVLESIDQAYCVCTMVVVDGEPVDYRFVEVNPLFEQMTGVVDAPGHTALELVPDLERHWIETYARVALGGETLRFEQGSDAMGRWFDVFAVPVAPRGHFALVFRDQTERRAAEVALLESEQRFRTMADHLPMFVWKYGADGQRIWVNQTMCDFFGRSRDEMIAGQWTAPTHPDDDDDLPAAFERSVLERTTFHAEARVRRRDGAWRWIETWGRPRFGPNGDYAGHLGTSVDITERREGELAAQRGAMFLRRLIDNLFSFVGVLTPDGTLIETNRAPLEAAGMAPDDVLGQKFWDARWWSVTPETQTQLRDAVERAVGGETVRYDVQVRGIDDELTWIDFQLAPLRDDDGTVTHLVPSANVIDERIETERRLAAALDAERDTRRRVELLQRNATQLAGAITIDELATALLGELHDSLGLGFTALEVVVGEHITVIARSKPLGAAVDRSAQMHVDADLPGPIAIRTNQPVVLSGFDHIAARFPDVVDPANGLPPFETLAALPLRAASGRAIGALFLASVEAGWLDETTLDMLSSIAGQAGLALERAELHQQVLDAREQEHTIAIQLQRALLPDRLATHTNLEIAARYSAASDLMAVGGDWYDTFSWPDGHLVVTVGDVVGHDLAAATTMGRLRIGVNALVSRAASSPAMVLDAYRDYGDDLGPAFATAACVAIHGDTGQLRYSIAGHPAPLIVHTDGRLQWLARAVAPPLGVPSACGHVDSALHLEPGATVVLYSDGLIERRGEIIDEGFERLAASAVRHAGSDPEALADLILGDLTRDVEIADDVIVVCVRWSPAARQ
jgi:PAS domain S-box-containing protein